MLDQTVDSLLPLLTVLQQPAFCLRQDGTVCGNALSAHLAPANGNKLTQWLGETVELYMQWDRQTALTVPVRSCGPSCSATVQALSDGELFLLSDCEPLSANGPLGVSSQVLTENLSKLTASFQNMLDVVEEQESLSLAAEAAGVTRNLFRMTRMARNLSAYEAILRDEMTIRPTKLSLLDNAAPILEEISSAVREAGADLQLLLPREDLLFCADWPMLERALLNLLDNALLHGLPGQPVQLQVIPTAAAILFRLRSRTASGGAMVDAFHRLQQRGVVPDPHWGMGLGIPIALHIARLHEGTLAIEQSSDGLVTATLSIGRKLVPADNSLQSPTAFDLTGGLDPRLLELADVLPASFFAQQL